MEFKVGMYVRVSVDYEDSINPRMFAVGQIKKIKDESVIVMFHKINRSKHDEIIHNYIPSEKEYLISELEKSKILDKSKIIHGFDILEIISFAGTNEDGFNLYYARDKSGKIELVNENNILVDFNRGRANVLKQMLNYEFHNPFWYGKRTIASEALNMMDNFGDEFKTLLGSRTYLFEHQIDTIVRALNEENCRLILADEVGLGKTIEALVIIKGLKKPKEKILMIIPDSLVNQWKYELDVKFWMEATIYNGSNINKSDIVIVPLSIIENMNFIDIKNKFDYCIIDEVHRAIKDKKIYKQFLNICKSISKVLLLSATPIQSRKEEYLKLLTLLNPDKYETMNDREFLELYNKNSKIKRIVHKISRNLPQVYGREIDEEGIEEILDYIDDICSDLEDRCLDKMFKILEDLFDDEEFEKCEEKIREILAYISITYQFESNIIRHRRDELKYILPKRELDLHHYIMKSSSESYYESNVYTTVLEYINKLKLNISWNDYLYTYITQLLNATLSSPWAIKSLLICRQKSLRNIADKSNVILYNQLKNLKGFSGELEIIEDALFVVNKWENAAKEELININKVLDDPELGKGRIAKIIDYIEQELYDNKIVLFSSWSETVEVMKNTLEELYGKESVVTFCSKDDKESLEENVKLFQNDKKCKFMICDELGGEGRNFQMADALIHIDIPFSPTVLEQRIGRLDRIGRDKDKKVCNVVFVSEDTIEMALFNLWNEGLNIFNESLSGLEIALEDIYNEVVNSLKNDIEYGLYDSLNEIKKKLIIMKAAVEEERYYDMARQLDYSTKKKYESLINIFDHDGGKLLGDMMLAWSTAVGFIPANVEDGIVEFDRTSVNNISLEHTMFTLPDTRESLKRSKKANVIKGTFDRSLAINKEDLVFFAPGESIFDSILTNVEEGYRGKSIAVSIKDAPFEWEGFVFKYNAKFGINELLKNDYDIRYELYSHGNMPVNQFTYVIPINEYDVEINKVKKFVNEDMKELILKKGSKTKHLGQRSGVVSAIDIFKKEYPKNVWSRVVKKANKEAKLKLSEDYVQAVDMRKVNREFSKILASEVIRKEYFNKESNPKELRNILKAVQNGLMQPQFDLDSIMYIKMEIGNGYV